MQPLNSRTLSRRTSSLIHLYSWKYVGRKSHKWFTNDFYISTLVKKAVRYLTACHYTRSTATTLTNNFLPGDSASQVQPVKSCLTWVLCMTRWCDLTLTFALLREGWLLDLLWRSSTITRLTYSYFPTAMRCVHCKFHIEASRIPWLNSVHPFGDTLWSWSSLPLYLTSLCPYMVTPEQ